MRLKPDEVAAIKAIVAEHFDELAVVRLFGSQVDDSRQGGDVDRVVETDASWTTGGCGLMRELRERADVVLNSVRRNGSLPTTRL